MGGRNGGGKGMARGGGDGRDTGLAHSKGGRDCPFPYPFPFPSLMPSIPPFRIRLRTAIDPIPYANPSHHTMGRGGGRGIRQWGGGNAGNWMGRYGSEWARHG